MKIDTNAVWEFFSPFAHIPGRYEWCRIHSPTHGSFDTFIVIRESTDRPPVVYVNSPEGQRFMAERYPESSCFMVEKEKLTIRSADDGATVEGRLEADEGPISRAQNAPGRRSLGGTGGGSVRQRRFCRVGQPLGLRRR